jgi:hypothetical protein
MRFGGRIRNSEYGGKMPQVARLEIKEKIAIQIAGLKSVLHQLTKCGSISGGKIGEVRVLTKTNAYLLGTPLGKGPTRTYRWQIEGSEREVRELMELIKCGDDGLLKSQCRDFKESSPDTYNGNFAYYQVHSRV